MNYVQEEPQEVEVVPQEPPVSYANRMAAQLFFPEFCMHCKNLKSAHVGKRRSCLFASTKFTPCVKAGVVLTSDMVKAVCPHLMPADQGTSVCTSLVVQGRCSLCGQLAKNPVNV